MNWRDFRWSAYGFLLAMGGLLSPQSFFPESTLATVACAVAAIMVLPKRRGDE